jgi:hypothetical protein
MAINTIVYKEKNIMTAGALLTTLHNSHVCIYGPKGQYFNNSLIQRFLDLTLTCRLVEWTINRCLSMAITTIV